MNCATCHQGVGKPLYGQSMLKNHPELSGPNHLLNKTVAPAPKQAAADAAVTVKTN
ncbi:MAG: photosynthetic reaction center cytochrome c subunit family protein [Burkholderiaceae bacterium]